LKGYPRGDAISGICARGPNVSCVGMVESQIPVLH
jgi:hypothetical protein